MEPGHPAPTTRRLLARVRDVMAGAGTGQERLDRMVSIIAANMVAEVCSIYVRRPGDVLELFASEGLRPQSVHHTHLRVSEGLVGNIAARARPMALSDVQNHPHFAYRPQTGEEIYHSLMGVPILRDGRVIGVLVVQNKARRQYAEEEIEVLETVAMVLAEMVAGGDLVDRDELQPGDRGGAFPNRVEGVQFNSGIGMGHAVLHKPRFRIRKLVAEDPEIEHERLRKAVADMHGALDDMLQSDRLAAGGEHRDVLEAYRLIAEDAGWLSRIGEAITSGLTAEAAVQKVQNDIRARMNQVSDPYLRERIHDLEDLANRLLLHLLGPDEASLDEILPENMIVVAQSMGPAQLLDYNRHRLRGLVLEEGSPTAHVCIVARALDIPVVGHVPGILGLIDQGDSVIVDGDHAQVFVRPGEDVREAFEESLKARAMRVEEWAVLRTLPALTLEGEEVSVHINAGLLADLAHVEDAGIAGVGLYRTEIPFMVRSEFPSVEAQQRLYARVFAKSGGKPVCFRTLDVGGDKPLPYWPQPEEDNPAMGWRAIRVTLDRPAMLLQQLRALIRACDGRELNLMFPMVSEMAELKAARALLEQELESEERRGTRMPARTRVGVVLEVPSLLFQLRVLLRQVDFVSIGSNDLFQFLFAADRGNRLLAERYDPLSPVALTVVRSIVAEGQRAGVSVSVCGEMAGRSIDCMALIGAGMRNISVSPPAVGPIKAMVRSLSVSLLRDFMESFYDLDDHSVRERLREFACDHRVAI